MKKKILNIILVVSMLLSVSANIYADGTDDKYGVNSFLLDYPKYQTRSLDLPTEYYDLSENDYNATLSVVGKNKLYTNRWFYSNGDGRIYVDYSVKSSSGSSNLYIGLYNATKHKHVVEYDAISVGTNNKNGRMYFYGLNPAHKYVIYFRAHPKSISGSATISH